MTKTFNELINYLINPILEEDTNHNFFYRCKVLLSLLLISITISFLISLVNGFLTSIGVLHEISHITDTLFEDSSSFKILFLASNLSNPIYSFGAFSLILPASVNILIISRLFLCPTS